MRQGLIGQLRATHNLTRLAQYTAELYAALEKETGAGDGFPSEWFAQYRERAGAL